MKKTIIGFLFITLFVISPVVSKADTIADIQAQIASLNAELAALSSNQQSGSTDQTNSALPSITSISKTTGVIGSTITIHGTGFSITPNVSFILMNGLVASGQASSDGTTLTLTIPSVLLPNCNLFVLQGPCPANQVVVAKGVYQLSVATENGTSNSVAFSVVNSSQAQSPMSVISPNGGSIKDTDTLTVSWTPYNSGPFDYYRVLIGNDKIPGYLTNLFPDNTVSSSTTSTSTANLQSVISEIVANSTSGKTFDQIKNSFFVQVDPIVNSSTYGDLVLANAIGKRFTVTPSIAKPKAPTAFRAKTDSSCGVDLSWKAVPNATSYNIYRSTKGGLKLFVSGLTTNSYTDLTATSTKVITKGNHWVPDSTDYSPMYNYQVSAVNSTGESSKSDNSESSGRFNSTPSWVSVAGSKSCYPANTIVPSITSISPNPGQVGSQITISGKGFSGLNKIIWTGHANDGTGYDNSIDANATSSDFSSVGFVIPSYIKPGTYKVSVLESYSTTTPTYTSSVVSNEVSFKVTSAVVVNPPQITSVPATAFVGQIVTIVGSGFTKTGNSVLLTDSSNNTVTISDTLSNDGKTLKFIVPLNSPLGNGIVHVTNANGSSGGLGITLVSNTVSSVPTKPKAPVVTTGSTCGGQIIVSWSPVDGATSYNVYRLSGNMYVKFSNSTGLTSTSFTDSVIPGSKNNSYKITAVNAVGESAQSSASSGKASAVCKTSLLDPLSQSASVYDAIKILLGQISDSLSLLK